MPYSPTLLIHILGGTVGLLAGTAAIIFRKGSPRHALAGRVFVVAMLVMGTFAAYLAVLKHQPNNFIGGVFTFYLILTAWLTARRGNRQTSRWDWFLLLIPLALGGINWTNGIAIARGKAEAPDGVPVGMLFFMGSIMLLAAAGDVQMLLSGGMAGAQRIARHAWRMCFGLFIAAGSFFMGPNNRPLRLLTTAGLGSHLSPAIFSTGLYLTLTLAPLILLIYWLIRLRFTNFYKQRTMRVAPARTN
jgi:uncharacterized membrane protein